MRLIINQRNRIVNITVIVLLCYSQIVEANGFNYLANTVELNLTAIGSWEDIDVSSYVPSGSTGVILQMVNNGPNGARFAIRKNGSDFDLTNYSIMSPK